MVIIQCRECGNYWKAKFIGEQCPFCMKKKNIDIVIPRKEYTQELRDVANFKAK